MGNNSSFIYWAAIASLATASLALISGSGRYQKEEKHLKIKDNVWRDIFISIQDKLDHVTPKTEHKLEVVRLELEAALEQYINEHGSQSKYLNPLLNTKIRPSKKFSYKNKIKAVRQTLTSLLGTIDKED